MAANKTERKVITPAGILIPEPEPVKAADLLANGTTFFLYDLRTETVKGRQGNPDREVLTAAVEVGEQFTGRLTADGGMAEDIISLLDAAMESEKVDEETAAGFYYGPLKVTRVRRAMRLSPAEG